MGYTRIFLPLENEAGGYEFKGRKPAGRAIAESRNGEGRLTVWAQDIKPETRYGVYLIFADGAKFAGVHINTVSACDGGKVEARKDFSPESLSGFMLDEMVGVALVVNDGLSRAQPIAPLCGYRDGATSWKNNFHEVRTAHGDNREAHPVRSESREPIVEATPALEAVRPAQSDNREPVIEETPALEAESAVEVEEPLPVAEDVRTEEDAQAEELLPTVEDAQAEEIPSPETDLQNEPVSDTNQFELEVRPAHGDNREPICEATPALEAAEDVPVRPAHSDNREPVCEAAPALEAAEDVPPVEEEVRPAHGDNREPICEAAPALEAAEDVPPVEEISPPVRQKAPRAKKPATATAPKAKRPAESPPKSENGTENIMTIESIFNNKPHVTPFESFDRDAKWVQLAMKDAVPLPHNRPLLLEEPFVRAAFASHDHLLLGVTSDGAEYILGVPCEYNPDERPHAKRLGFSKFKTNENTASKRGDKGYWLMFVDM